MEPTNLAQDHRLVFEEALAAPRPVAAHDRTSPWAASHGLVGLFAATLFASAFLLFLVQPMVGKMVLPILGGAPMVWNACMVFFQIALLAGYAYAHGSTRWFGARAQLILHVGVLMAPFVVLPFLIRPEAVSPPQSNQVGWLLLLLTGTIGLPFFVLSTSASMLQHWFSKTGHRSAADPYFLYAASNLGSLLALAAYPVVVEPLLPLQEQSRFWAFGYGLFVAMTAVCAAVAWRGAGGRPGVTEHVADPALPRAGDQPLTPGRRARWVALSFIPSSLMLAVTSYLSTDIAAVPLLWIAPLGLYLTTFVAAFSSKASGVNRVVRKMFPLAIVLLALMMSTGSATGALLLLPLHLLTFTAAALLCHGRLASDRPEASRLTEFYLWISVGGMLGGLFNTFVAPALFNGIFEYPLVLVLACLFVEAGPSASGARKQIVLDLVAPLAIGGLTAALVLWLPSLGAATGLVIAAVGVPVILAFSQRGRPVRFGLSVGAILLAGLAFGNSGETLLHAERTFFGVYRIHLDRDGEYRALTHGTTLHGMQALTAPEQGEPLTYFHRAGPFGQAFATLPSTTGAGNIAVIGLGVGTLAAYARPDQRWTFFEIDPAVERIARNPAYFNFLERCGDRCRVVIGDARLSLARPPAQTYDLLVLDAFSSDSIPIHLLTRDALSLYVERLSPGGAILFHISNRHLSLAPMVGNLAAAEGMVAFAQFDRRRNGARSRFDSDWVVMARRREDLGPLVTDSRWKPVDPSPAIPVWTDDFSNILSVLRIVQ